MITERPKIMISQPMTGLTDEEIGITRNKITKLIVEKWPRAVILCHTMPIPIAGIETEQLLYLSADIRTLACATAIVFDKDWESSKGCQVERFCAIAYDIPIFDTTHDTIYPAKYDGLPPLKSIIDRYVENLSHT